MAGWRYVIAVYFACCAVALTACKEGTPPAAAATDGDAVAPAGSDDSSGDGDGDADGGDAGAGDTDDGDAEVGNADDGDTEVGDAEVGDAEVGDADDGDADDGSAGDGDAIGDDAADGDAADALISGTNACMAKNTQCTSAVWSLDGCIVQSKSGSSCNGGSCAGICDSNGECLCKPTKDCGSTGPCFKSGPPNAAGECVQEYAAEGTSCKSASDTSCMVVSGTCNEVGECVHLAATSTSCSLGTVACPSGFCGTKPSCQKSYAAAGKACGAPKATVCFNNTAACDGLGACIEASAALLGAPCPATPPSQCHAPTGLCSAAGVCESLVLPGKSCDPPGAGDCKAPAGICDAAGDCQPSPGSLAGQPCAYPYDSLGPCAGPPGAGLCSKEGKCEPAYAVGKACKVGSGSGPYGSGICSKTGNCEAAPTLCKVSNDACGALGVSVNGGICMSLLSGQPCVTDCFVGNCNTNGYCEADKSVAPKAATGTECNVPPTGLPDPCKSAKGHCNSGGLCVAKPIAAGSPCKDHKLNSSSCHKDGGYCDTNGSCVTPYLPTGATCAVLADQSTCKSTTGTCSADHKCIGTPINAGKSCTPPFGINPNGVCSPNGECQAIPKYIVGEPATACTATTCNASGVCKVGPAPVGTWCDSNSTSACKGTIGECNAKGECAFTTVAAGTACVAQNKAGPCEQGPSTCDGKGNCAFTPLPIGAECSSAGALCKSYCTAEGSCSAVSSSGSGCAIGSGPCAGKTGTCTAAGVCIGPKSCAPPPLSDKDTDCWGVSCDATGSCKPVPHIAGKSCGVEPADGCVERVCNGQGSCIAKGKAGGTCERSECQKQEASKGSACPVAPCWAGGCTAAGMCTVGAQLPEGHTCMLGAFAGTCTAAGACKLVGEGSNALAGTPCLGTFPCMKEDVAYGADGVCHGTVAVGQACGGLCNPGICSANGTCNGTPAPAGTNCGKTYDCGELTCDGKGGCTVAAIAPGAPCKQASSYTCRKAVCGPLGVCEHVITPGASCKSGACTVGVCSELGICEQLPLPDTTCSGGSKDCAKISCDGPGGCKLVPTTGNPCALPDAPVCTEGTCSAGKCVATVATGKTCGQTGWCQTSICNAKGECEVVPTPGAACPAGKGDCYAGVCDSAGKCQATPIPAGTACAQTASKVENPCEKSACNGAGQCVSTPAADETLCYVGCVARKCLAGTCAGEEASWKEWSNTCPSDTVCQTFQCCKGEMMDPPKCYYGATAGQCVGIAKMTPVGGCSGNPCFSSSCSDDGSCVQKVGVIPGCGGQLSEYYSGLAPGLSTCGVWFACEPLGGCKPCLGQPDDYLGCKYGAMYSFCDDANPCTAESCAANQCTFVPANEGKACGPFLTCQSGHCVQSPP